MEVTRENLLKMVETGLKREGLSISGLEKKAAVPKDTIRDFLRGKTQILRADKLQKILRVLEPEELIQVTGYVGANGVIKPYSGDGEEVPPAPGMNISDVVAIKIEGDAMLPLFHDGWVIYYSHDDAVIPIKAGGWQVPYRSADSHEPHAAFAGKPCVVKIKNGDVMLRTLKPGTEPNRYNLVSYSSSDIKNAEIDWAARIVFIKTA